MEKRDQFPYIKAVLWLWSQEDFSSFLIWQLDSNSWCYAAFPLLWAAFLAFTISTRSYKLAKDKQTIIYKHIITLWLDEQFFLSAKSAARVEKKKHMGLVRRVEIWERGALPEFRAFYFR